MRLSPSAQMGSIFATACVMWVLAVALSLCSDGCWYSWYRLHEGALLTPFADQQIGAGIMWTCGAFWAVPIMIRAIRRLIEQRGDEGLDAVVDALVTGRRRVRVSGRLPGPVHSEISRQLAAAEARRAAAPSMGVEVES